MNIVIYLFIFITCISTLYFANKFLDKFGLIITIICMNVASFLLTFKYVTLSTISLNSNCITYVTMLISLYILSEKTNKKEARQIANLTFTAPFTLAKWRSET